MKRAPSTRESASLPRRSLNTCRAHSNSTRDRGHTIACSALLSLLDLARRKKLRDEVERASAELTESATPSIDAIKLRVAILDAEGRPKDVEPLLASISRGSTSLETLEWLEQIAHQRSLVRLEEAALEKQAEVTSDPVRKLDLRYSLVRFYEAKKDLPQAQRNVDALYSENPQILGVVRATVNFYWSNHQPQRAVEVLLQAAGGAYPTLAAQLRFEAARKASESGQHEQARTLLSQLLAGSPFNEEYLAAMAEAYGRVGDDQGLKKFSLEKIEELRTAQLPTEQRTRQIAALRRGLVPALTRLKDYAGAVDQYIEVINRYPEDDALLAEAALYAQSHGRLLCQHHSAVSARLPLADGAGQDAVADGGLRSRGGHLRGGAQYSS